MGGSIAVTSQLGVGSTFVITLPFEIAPSPEQTPDAHAAPDISIAGCRLLLVEDNALNAEIAQILLTDEGATCAATCPSSAWTSCVPWAFRPLSR